MTEERVQLRPLIPSLKLTKDMSNEEVFQNQTLRPVIKMQHELLMAHFKYYLRSKNCVLAELSEREQADLINAAFSRDLQFRCTIQGMILGQFTAEEYSVYKKRASDINKRIIQIIKERVLSSLDELVALP